jgi:hypothetical protein
MALNSENRAKQKRLESKNSSLCETAYHLEYELQTYKKSTVSPKPRHI